MAEPNVERRHADPTALTIDQIDRAAKAERDYTDGVKATLEQRLDAIDKATELLSETINRVPTTMQTEILHMRDLVNERFNSVGSQFAERDERVALILAMNEKAIDKSDGETRQTISKLQDLLETKVDALSKQLDDLQGRIDRGEGRDTGEADTGAAARLNIGTGLQAVAVILTFAGLLVLAFHK